MTVPTPEHIQDAYARQLQLNQIFEFIENRQKQGGNIDGFVE